MVMVMTSGLVLLAASRVLATSSISVGDIRVSALSANLVRVEPRGPHGFEDRATFSIVGRGSFAGVPLTKVNDSFLTTEHYSIELRRSAPPTCAAPANRTDVVDPVNSGRYSVGAAVADVGACCALCDGDESCTAWVFKADIVNGINCWPLTTYGGLKTGVADRVFGCAARMPTCTGPSFAVRSPKGPLLYDSETYMPPAPSNLLHFPAPLSGAPTYALVDAPRFIVPSWGPAPVPAGAVLEPALVPTHGYDFLNDVGGDTYVALLGDDAAGYAAARAALVTLTGPCPLLPDFAFGTWFTWWHSYSEAEAKDDISHWERLGLPIDVWALDMNWRNTSDNQDRYCARTPPAGRLGG